MSEDPRVEAVAELLQIKFCFPRWGYPYPEGERLEDAREILAAADAKVEDAQRSEDITPYIRLMLPGPPKKRESYD